MKWVEIFHTIQEELAALLLFLEHIIPGKFQKFLTEL